MTDKLTDIYAAFDALPSKITAGLLTRLADAVTAEVVKSGAIWNAAAASNIIAAEIEAFASDPRYADLRADLGRCTEESDIAEKLSSECIFELRLSDPNRADEPAIRHIKALR